MLKIVKNQHFTYCQVYLCICMSRKFLLTIAIFMALAMLGLIFVQAYWINNAYRLKENQFSQAVNRAMQFIAGELQEREAMWHIMDEVDVIDSSWTSGQDFFSFQYQGYQSTSEIKVDINASIQEKEILNNQVHIYEHINPRDGKYEITIVSDDTVLRREDYPGLNIDTSQIGSIAVVHPDQLKTQVQQSISQKRVLLDRVMGKMLSPNTPLEQRINQETLNRVIDRHLANSGIDLDYEYAVLRDNLEMAFHTDNFDNDPESEYFVTSLFPQDIFSQSGYLSMYFPGEKSFLFKSIGIMGISSMILTIVIVMSFTITMYIIFRQKKLSEIRNDFVNNMTHELKTPISTISLASQMLNDKSIPDKSKNIDNISGIITEESKRLGYQVEKVLQMAIFDRGRMRLKKKKTDINELIQQVVANFALQIKNKNGLVSETYEAEKSTIEVDPVHFTNLISNLMDNAIKYSGDDPQVGIETFNKNDKLYIRVRDNGIGIRKEDQKRVFEKFYRVPTGNIHNVKGFGLGLSYVKKIVEEHNGSVSLRSELNKGTEFEISIPLNYQ
jgi:two-component system, OmpR family, phosphate regulon sensor histidine kinase PhoR